MQLTCFAYISDLSCITHFMICVNPLLITTAEQSGFPPRVMYVVAVNYTLILAATARNLRKEVLLAALT